MRYRGWTSTATANTRRRSSSRWREENVESVGEFDYFTFLSVGRFSGGFAAPTEYGLALDDGRLTLHYTLPLAQPLFSRGDR